VPRPPTVFHIQCHGSDAALYLASDEAAYVSGVALRVDGALTA
jgi:NAD(P)-dependent dehydrogenase (short-subunit alcohol dehydrogenase family)